MSPEIETNDKIEEIKHKILDAKELDDEETPEVQPIQYDRNLSQRVPMSVPRGDQIFDVEIELAPITDEDYFALTEAVPENAKKIKGVSIEVFKPYAELGRKRAVARHGFKERSDWREKTNDLYFVNAVQGILECEPASDGVKADGLLDDDAEILVKLKVAFQGKEVYVYFYFREETKDEMDEYMRALRGEPQKGVLASAKRVSKEQRLYALYEKTKVRVENYVNDNVPAFHAVKAVEAFFLLELARVGKPELI